MLPLQINNDIHTCLQTYIAGAVKGDSMIMRGAMHSDAQIFGYLDNELFAGPMQLLYDYVDAHEPAGADLSWAVSLIDESNGVACARVFIRNWGGHDFTDYFTLCRTDGHWQIMNKVFSHS
jgi:hypothetical protein